MSMYLGISDSCRPSKKTVVSTFIGKHWSLGILRAKSSPTDALDIIFNKEVSFSHLNKISTGMHLVIYHAPLFPWGVPKTESIGNSCYNCQCSILTIEEGKGMPGVNRSCDNGKDKNCETN